jgi:hypothetical protein
MCGYGNQKELELQHSFPKGNMTCLVSFFICVVLTLILVFESPCLPECCGTSKFLAIRMLIHIYRVFYLCSKQRLEECNEVYELVKRNGKDDNLW